jgi:hypothetical protein
MTKNLDIIDSVPNMETAALKFLLHETKVYEMQTNVLQL